MVDVAGRSFRIAWLGGFEDAPLGLAADVSRSWLYTQPGIRGEIQRLRETTRRAPGPTIPASQRASEASLFARLQASLDRNRKLAEENQRLRRQLAHSLGQQRSSPHARDNGGITPGGSPSGNNCRPRSTTRYSPQAP